MTSMSSSPRSPQPTDRVAASPDVGARSGCIPSCGCASSTEMPIRSSIARPPRRRRQGPGATVHGRFGSCEQGAATPWARARPTSVRDLCLLCLLVTARDTQRDEREASRHGPNPGRRDRVRATGEPGPLPVKPRVNAAGRTMTRTYTRRFMGGAVLVLAATLLASGATIASDAPGQPGDPAAQAAWLQDHFCCEHAAEMGVV